MSPLVRKALKIVAALAGTAAVTPFLARWVGRRALEERVARDVEQLLQNAQTKAGVITEDDIAPLPEPVQNYLRFAGVLGRERIATATLHQHGRTRITPHAPWQSVLAQHTLSTSPAGYSWHGTVATGLFAVELRESYIDGSADIVAKLSSIVPLLEARGPEIDQSSLVRYLAELPYVPTALVDEVRWEPLDSERARVFLTHGEQEVSAICTFDPATGALVNLVAERWRDEDGFTRKCAWSMPYDEYFEFDGLIIPRHTAFIWHDVDEEFEYLRLEVLHAEFNVSSAIGSTESADAHSEH